jgi:hypothetical protein
MKTITAMPDEYLDELHRVAYEYFDQMIEQRDTTYASQSAMMVIATTNLIKLELLLQQMGKVGGKNDS